MVNYNKTIIYKIICKDLTVTDLYVGSTSDFKRRKINHKSKCCNENSKSYNYKVYTMIRSNGGWDNWQMVEIEEIECNNGNEARSRERYYLELLQANMNSQVPSRSRKELTKEYRDLNKNKAKEYRDLNKDKMKDYRDLNKDKIKEYYELNKNKAKEQKKEYYELNKDKIKNYYNTNKDAINLKRKELRQSKTL